MTTTMEYLANIDRATQYLAAKHPTWSEFEHKVLGERVAVAMARGFVQGDIPEPINRLAEVLDATPMPSSDEVVEVVQKKTASDFGAPPPVKYNISFKFRLSHEAATVGRVECHVTTGSKIVRFGVDNTQRKEKRFWIGEKFSAEYVDGQEANKAIRSVAATVKKMFSEWSQLERDARPTPVVMLAMIKDKCAVEGQKNNTTNQELS